MTRSFLRNMSIDHKIEHIRKIKRAEYGSFTKNLTLIGKSWSALLDLDQPIPPEKVALMYAASKVVRAAYKYKEDNFIDALNYLRKAQQIQQQEASATFNTDGPIKDQVDG